MKAVYIEEHGGVEVLTYGDMPEPVVGPNDVKIRVRACAVNRVDVFTRAGVRGTRLPLDEPHILGGDVAGEVVEAGSEVDRVRPGDRVVAYPRILCGQCRHCIAGEDEQCRRPLMLGTTTNGGYAEYVAVSAVSTVPLPESIGYDEAASLPTVFVPTWNMLIRRAVLRPWETALVLSASSGVGSAAVQVAKAIVGARVIATTSTEEKARKARKLGADEVVVYTQEDIADRVKELTGGRGVDVIVDHVGSDFWSAAHRIAGAGRSVRHMRCDLGLSGRAPDGAALRAQPDGLRRVHGEAGGPQADRRHGREGGDPRSHSPDLPSRSRRQCSRGDGSAQLLREASADDALAV